MPFKNLIKNPKISMVSLLTTDPILANELAIILLLVSGLLSKSIFVPEILQYFKIYLNSKINKIYSTMRINENC